MSGTKYLSGINYYTSGTAEYDSLVENVYRNTYNPDTDAISFTCLNSSSPSTIIPALTSVQDESHTMTIVNKLVTIDSNIRLIDESINCLPFVKRTLQGNTAATIQSINNILMDDIDETSTLLIEHFNGETYRIIPDDYNTYGTISGNTFDSTISIANISSAGYNDSLQVIDDILIYPANTSYPNDFSAIANGPAGNPDYTGSTGDRTYYRYFRQVTPTTGNFKINILGSGGTFVDAGTALSSNNIHLHFKAPGSAGAETGWLDAYADFATNQWNDDDGGRNATDGAGRAFGTDWGLTIGTKNTANTDGYIVIKITVGDNFTGNISRITFSFE
jgi:hypothetical protein